MSVQERKKVLFLSIDGLSDALGRSQIVPYLNRLSEYFKITVVSAEKNFRGLNISGFKSSTLAPSIAWFPVSYSNRFPFLSQWLTLRRLRQKAFALNRKNEFQLVHARSYMPMLVAEKLKKHFQIRTIFDMRGFWADERVEGKIWNLKKIRFRKIYSFFKQKEKKWLQQSEAIVVLTEAAKNYLVSAEKIPGSKLAVIPCCCDLDFFHPDHLNPDRKNVLKIQLGIYEKDSILCYAGSLGTWYLLDEMLKFFRLLSDQQPEWKFLFITSEKKESILECARRFSLMEEKIIVKQASRDEMPQLLSLADVGIFFIQNSFSKMASSPVKLGEFLAMGIPVISNSGIGDDDGIIRYPENGVLMNDFSEQVMNDAIRKIKQLLHIPKERIRESASNHFNLNNGVEKYRIVYNSLLTDDADSGSLPLSQS